MILAPGSAGVSVMRWSVSSLLVVLAFVFSILSAVATIPLWIAVMLLALSHLVGEHGFVRTRI
jgi:hypothetical protein